MKKFLSIIFSLLIILSLCSCKSKTENSGNSSETVNAKESTLSLAYSISEDLDPFAVETVINTQLMTLVYDGLYKLDKTYKPVPTVAKSGIVSETTVNITLNNVRFSDGTSVTAPDVAYSFNRAKESPTYKTKLANFESVDVTANNMLMFHMTEPNAYALSDLTFPIVKNGLIGLMPVGCGRYVFQKDGEKSYLIVNTNKSGFNPTIKTITLVPVRGDDYLQSSLEIGNIGFCFNDLADGKYSRINAHCVEMGINNFVYLGINYESTIFSDVNIRKAINLVIDRNEIASSAFHGHARAVYSPFNPDWYALSSKDLTVTNDKEEAEKIIEESETDIGYRDISILVNQNNPFKVEAAEIIKKELEDIGFAVTVKDYAEEYYKEALSSGEYDLYIGEYKLTPDMDLNPLFSGELNIGINPECESAARYNQLLNGKCELMDFVNTFNEDLPVIPLCYRNAVASYTNSTNADFACCEGDVYFDIETWRYK